VSATETKPKRRQVDAELLEATPWGLGYWLLASPLLAFLAWQWADLFVHFSPISSRLVDVILAVISYSFAVVLPFGLLAHWVVTAFPGFFQNTGWDVQPLQTVDEAEQYTVRYRGIRRSRAASTWRRLWLRAAQGWVFIEVAVILIGGILMIPLFFSAAEFGFGR
jgi:hypothetical protein